MRLPFRGAERQPTLAELVELLGGIYGARAPFFDSSPYAETRWDSAELILHELAHATQIAGEWPVRRGRMGKSWKRISASLSAKGQALSDRHEMRAIAIEIGVARRLRLPLSRSRLVSSGARNCRSWDLAKEHARFSRAVDRAERTPAVWSRIQRILDLLDDAWKRRCKRASCLASSSL